jgi:uncharacterized protein (TIGR02145 family)
MKTITISNLIIAILFNFTFSLTNVSAQNDTMYMMKGGVAVGKYNVNTQVDSVIFYNPIKDSENSSTFTDSRDGYVYKLVKIGNQVWMAENLKYLPSVVGPVTGSETTPYYYVYGYNGTDVNAAKATDNYINFGVLYNWSAAMIGSQSSAANPSGAQGICPTGWHLPSDAEWTQLENYLANNGYNYDGTTGGGGAKIAKAMAHTSWWSSNAVPGAIGSTDYSMYRNKSGFKAIPGAIRSAQGNFTILGDHGDWWSATEDGLSSGWYRSLHYNLNYITRNSQSKSVGFSVRCIKD